MRHKVSLAKAVRDRVTDSDLGNTSAAEVRVVTEEGARTNGMTIQYLQQAPGSPVDTLPSRH